MSEEKQTLTTKDRQWIAWLIAVVLIVMSGFLGVKFPALPPTPQDDPAMAARGITHFTQLDVSAPTAQATNEPAAVIDTAGVGAILDIRDAATPVFRILDGGSIDIDTQIDLDGTAFDVDITTGFSIDGDAASNINTAGAGIDLTLESEAGRVVIKGDEAAVDGVLIDANDAVTTGVTIQVGSVSGLVISGGPINASAKPLVNIGNAGTDFGSDGSLTTASTITVTAGGIVVTAGGIDVTDDAITNIGNAGTDFGTDGSLTTAAIITVTAGGIVVSDGDVVIADDMRITAQTALTVTDASGFACLGSYCPIQAAGEVTPTLSTGTTGDIWIIVNVSAQTINLADLGDAGGQDLTAAIALAKNDMIVVIFDGADWLELSRADN